MFVKSKFSFIYCVDDDSDLPTNFIQTKLQKRSDLGQPYFSNCVKQGKTIARAICPNKDKVSQKFFYTVV